MKIIAAAVLAFVLGVAWDELPHPILGWALSAALVALLWYAVQGPGEDD